MASDGSACCSNRQSVSVKGERFIIIGRFSLDSILYKFPFFQFKYNKYELGLLFVVLVSKD